MGSDSYTAVCCACGARMQPGVLVAQRSFVALAALPFAPPLLTWIGADAPPCVQRAPQELRELRMPQPQPRPQPQPQPQPQAQAPVAESAPPT